jgi:hypothetical protein
MIAQKPALNIAAILIGTLSFVSSNAEAQALQFYCYASEMDRSGDKVSRTLDTPGTFHVTPIFNSDDDPYLLMALFSDSVPSAGLATCVSEKDQPDLAGDRQQFLDGISADGGTVIVESPPVAATKPPTHKPGAPKCSKNGQCRK